MGRNKDLRKWIAGQQRVIEKHEAKICQEKAKPVSDGLAIAFWLHEIEVVRGRIDVLTRRLKRDW
jgi:ubiquinone biosynthesis protein UbiJ